MKKIKNLFLMCFVFIALFTLTSCLGIDQNTTLQFTILPEEQYVVDSYSEEEFKDAVQITVNGNQVVSLAELELAGATVSKVDFSTPGKQTVVISYEGAILTYEFYVVAAAPYVAQIGDQKYATLKEAFAAAPANTETTIQLISDKVYRNISADFITVAANQNIIFDLNGHTVKAYLVNQKSITFFGVNGQLTIMDSSETKNGAIKAEGMYNSDPYYVSVAVIKNWAGGKLTINSGNVINDCGTASLSYAIDAYQNSVTVINGGHIESKTYRAIRLFANSTTQYTTLEVHGGKIQSLNNNAIWFQAPSKGKSALVKAVFDGGEVISGGEYQGTPRYSINLAGDGEIDKFEVEITAGAYINRPENLPTEYFVK